MPLRAAILSVAAVLPENVVESSAIEELLSPVMGRLSYPRGIIEGLTGIRERRLWDPGVTPSAAAILAGRKALEKCGLPADRLGCLVSTSVSKDYLEPSVASLVHHGLGLSPHCVNFDVGNACLGFLDGINTVSMMIETGRIRSGMVVAGESSREPLENTVRMLLEPGVTAQVFQDNFATLTLGSGAAAMILAREDLAFGRPVIEGSVSLAATEHCRLCLGHRDRMTADAPMVMKHGVKLAHDTWKKAEQEIRGWSDENIDLYVPHQVSARNMLVLTRTLGLTAKKAALNFQYLGNVGPAAIPITLALSEEDGRFAPGLRAALLGIGSGLNCSMMSVRWPAA